jgi:hypothetical protein
LDEKVRVILRSIRTGPFRPNDDNAITEATRIAHTTGNLELLRSIAVRVGARHGKAQAPPVRPRTS